MGFNLGRALGGALGGAVAGSKLGPWGAVAGGVLGGGISGLATGSDARAQNEFRDVQYPVGNTAENMYRREQIGRLSNLANGNGPSLVGMQAASQLQQGRAQLESMAASDRRNPALARRNAMIQGGNLSARIGQQAMMGRLAEQQQAEQALAAAIHNAQSIDAQRAAIYNQARTARWNALTGKDSLPTGGENTTNMLSQVIPQAGNLYNALNPGPLSPAEQLKKLQEEDALRNYQAQQARQQQMGNNTSSVVPIGGYPNPDPGYLPPNMQTHRGR